MATLHTLTAPAPCTCGAELPWHLVALGNGRTQYTHHCRCGWSWRAQSTTTMAKVDATGRLVEMPATTAE